MVSLMHAWAKSDLHRKAVMDHGIDLSVVLKPSLDRSCIVISTSFTHMTQYQGGVHCHEAELVVISDLCGDCL